MPGRGRALAVGRRGGRAVGFARLGRRAGDGARRAGRRAGSLAGSARPVRRGVWRGRRRGGACGSGRGRRSSCCDWPRCEAALDGGGPRGFGRGRPSSVQLDLSAVRRRPRRRRAARAPTAPGRGASRTRGGYSGQRAGGPVRGRRIRGGAARQAALVRARAAGRRAGQPAPVAGAGLLRAARRGRARSRARCGARTGRRWCKRAGTVREGVQVVVAGGCDYYAGSASASPSFSFAVSDLRIAGEGDLLARIERLRKVLAAEGLLERQRRLPRALLPRTIGVVTGEGGKARDDVLAALARRGWAGRVVWGFAPVQDRHAAPAIGARAARPRGAGRRGRGDRRARRGLAGGPAVLLRRDAVPHGGAAGGAGDRVGRPSHRPHAARRRRGGELLDADARGGGGGGGHCGAGARGARARGGCACATTAAARCWAGRARWRASRARRRRTWRASGRGCTSRCARCARRRGGAWRTSARGRRGARWCSSASRRRRSLDCRARRPRELEQLALALAAHDPQRTLERGYALVESPPGEPVASAAAARAAGGAPALRRWLGRGGDRGGAHERRADARTYEATRRGSRRSSAAWTRARRASARRSSW